MAWDALHLQFWLLALRQELFLFAATFFLVGAIDELAVDGVWAWHRLTGRAYTKKLFDEGLKTQPLAGNCAVFIPAWREAAVIGGTIRHALSAWPQDELRLYVGCYRNDMATIAACMVAADGDPRLRVVIHDRTGPSSKADCLNRLYRALCEDEARVGVAARMVVLHDAEDFVDPHALALLDQGLDEADFLQLPVVALREPGKRFVAGHYLDEFAESHARTMVVRSHLGSGIPGAGVGMAIARPLLDRLERDGDQAGPFATGALTEDYELGLRLSGLGARTSFLRVRAADGTLVATRAYFPETFAAAIRQKGRWIHGISFQGWDRLGWRGSKLATWMLLRDRRGPLAAVMLCTAYLLVGVWVLEWALAGADIVRAVALPGWADTLLTINLCLLGWRLALRVAFTTREHGVWEGMLALPRTIVANVIAIGAARRALTGYLRELAIGWAPWEKTEHRPHALAARTAVGRWRRQTT